jgi:dynein light chain LC8-type
MPGKSKKKKSTKDEADADVEEKLGDDDADAGGSGDIEGGEDGDSQGKRGGGGEGKAGDDDDLPAGSRKTDASRDINANGAELKADVRSCKLGSRMKEQVLDFARQAIESSSVQTAVAKFVKTNMDKEFGPSWHVVVGREFGMSLSHGQDAVMYFYLGDIAVLVWQHSGSL